MSRVSPGLMGGGYGGTLAQGPGGWTQTFDPAKALQAQMAQEQWDWQKRMWGRQQKAAQTAAGGLAGLVSQYNQAYGSARAANEARYRQMLNIAGQTTQQRAADIRSEGAQRESDITQRLARVGMGNTTVVPTMQEGVRRGTQESLNRLADQMQQTRLGIMERRTDEYPQSNVILALAQALGQSGGGLGALGALGNLRLG